MYIFTTCIALSGLDNAGKSTLLRPDSYWGSGGRSSRPQGLAAIYPVCTDGQLACPTEDSGGIDGFYGNLEILKAPRHPEYKDTKRWLGPGYDPERFDIDKVNKALPKFKSWMKHWR